jgi:hypothetical protein
MEIIKFKHCKPILFIDLTGKFTFENTGFTISSLNINTIIEYTDIFKIQKEYYEGINEIGHSQYNPGKYSIILKDGKEYTFYVSRHEEQEYWKKIRKLNKKIYGINALGVHFNTKKFREKINNSDKDKEYEEKRPNCNYSLEKAINILLNKTGIELIDLTIEK